MPEPMSLPPGRSLAELLRKRPAPFVHTHLPMRDVNTLVAAQCTWGQRIPDR